MERSYIARNLRKSVTYKDLLTRPGFHSETNLESSILSACNFVSVSRSFSGKILIDSSKKKPIYTVPDDGAYLSLCLLNSNLKSIFQIKPSNRETVVRNLILFLKENTRFSVHRLDIKSFYESVNRRDLLSRLSATGKISRTSIDLIASLFLELDSIGCQGLPRGFALSSTLAEILLGEFDKKLESQRNVFFYARFVDDIVLITSPDYRKSDMLQKVKDLLPTGLEVHEQGDKIAYGVIEKAVKPNSVKPRKNACKTFGYLGYEYTPRLIQMSHAESLITKSDRLVEVDLSKDKFEKIKKRLILSFTSYMAGVNSGSGSFSLLKKRLAFLTGNYCLEMHRSGSKIYKMSGYHFNYIEINVDKKTKALDDFLRYLLFSNAKGIPRRISKCLNIYDRRELARCSFLMGYQRKSYSSFSYVDFVEISKVWK